MATPHKTTILAGIKTALEGISIANGHKTDVVTVEQSIKDWQSVPPSLRPWVGFKPNKERYQVDSPYHLWVTLPIYIGAHIIADTEALADIAIVNLQDDIIAALYADPTFGETAVDVKLIDGQSDIGDPDRLEGGAVDGYSGTFDMNWEVIYERTTSST
jgi:hypothetical protein